jgi:hypothetical protein
MLNLKIPQLLKKQSMSSKGKSSITAQSVLTFLPLVTIVEEEALEVVAVAEVVEEAVSVVVEEVEVVAGDVVVSVVAVGVELLNSRGRELHSKPCLSGTLLTLRALWALLACWSEGYSLICEQFLYFL